MSRADAPAPTAPVADYQDFEKIDVRLGTVVRAEEFPGARKPAFKLWIDFGDPLGIKKSSAQITRHYKLAELIGRRVAAVVNFAPRQIGPFLSEVLTLGFPDGSGEVVLLTVDRPAPDGGRLF